MITAVIFLPHVASPLSDISSHSRQNKNQPQFRSEYNVYSTFQSHEPEFDYLKSLEIEEKINKIRWLPQKNAAQFLLSTNGKFHFECKQVRDEAFSSEEFPAVSLVVNIVFHLSVLLIQALLSFLGTSCMRRVLGHSHVKKPEKFPFNRCYQKLQLKYYETLKPPMQVV